MPDNDILQGFQTGFNASLRRQELKSRNAMLRLQEQQVAQAMALKMQENQLQNQFRAEMATAMQAMQTATAEEIMVPMEGQEGIGDMAPPVMPVKNPAPMRRIDAFTQFMLPVITKYQPDKAGSIYNDVMANEVRMQEAQESRAEPQIKVVTGPDGREHQVFDPGGKGVRQLVAPAPSITEINGEQFYQSGPNRFTRIPKDIGDRQNKMAVLKAALEKAPHLLEVDEATGQAFLPPGKFNEAMRASGVPTAIKTQMMEQLAATAGAFEVGNLLLPLLTPANVGVPGFISRNLVDKGVAQVFPWMKIGRASDTKAIASNFRAGLVRAMRSDSSINKDEREEIIAGLPQPDAFASSPQESKSILAQQLELAAIKSRAAANILEKPITPFYLTKDEIREMLATSSITETEADKLMANNAWELIKKIRAEVQR